MAKDIENIIKSMMLTSSEAVVVERIESGFFKDGDVTYSSLPKMLRVAIVSKPGRGSLINIEVWLPDDWNGIFIGTGNGGFAGKIAYNYLSDYSRRGYAVANTDLGTSRGRESGINNPDVWKDFGWRATHLMTTLAKTIIKKFYGKKPTYSYFYGASTGGQQAFSEAQRFPKDYDGIIAGVPGNNRVLLHTYFLWKYVKLRTREGRPLFASAEANKITDIATEYFNSKKELGENKNYVSFPYINESTVDDFLDYLRRKCPDFTEEQLNALKAVYNGPVNPETNEQIYCGMPIASEIYPSGIMLCEGVESPHFYPFIWAFGKDYNGYDFDFSHDLDKILKKMGKELNANNPNLSAFYKRGGKLLAFSGSSDPCVPYADVVKYYNRVCEKLGGYDVVKKFFGLFIMPGKDHSFNGRGVTDEWSNENRDDLFCALRNWREENIEPEYIIGGRINRENPERPLEFMKKIYPYKGDKTEVLDFPKSCDERYLK